MLITIHQAEHMPWPGFFQKMFQADHFVILDSVPFTKNNVQNRNRIYSPNKGVDWLTVPVEMENHTSKPFYEMKLSPAQKDWANSYWGKFFQSYSKHPYFKLYGEEIKSIIFKGHTDLLSLNMDLIHFFRKHLLLNKPLSFSSKLGGINEKKGLLILEICKRLKATRYLSGAGGREYLDLEPWKEAGIDVVFQQFKYPDFPAKFYHPNLSTIDILMNCGPDAREYFLK